MVHVAFLNKELKFRPEGGHRVHPECRLSTMRSFGRYWELVIAWVHGRTRTLPAWL